jgi:hypothetical protein
MINFNLSVSINNGGSFFGESPIVASYNFNEDDVANHPAMSAVLFKK